MTAQSAIEQALNVADNLGTWDCVDLMEYAVRQYGQEAVESCLPEAIDRVKEHQA